MRAVDTNLLVRIVTRDDPRQVAEAEAFIQPGAWVSLLVLAETTWVLRSNFAFDHGAIANSIEMLLNHKHFVLQNSAVVAAALQHYRRKPSLRFFDCLILEIARHAGHLPLGTFDRALGSLDGTARL